MINNLSAQLTNRLISKGTISENEQELYCYGFFMLLSQLLYFILAAVFGLILGCFFESVIFYIAFQFIRRYAGGYHAKTETRCEILSLISLIACIILIRLSNSYNLRMGMFLLSIISSICIAIFSPIDTPEKPLTKNERKHFRKITLIILFVIIIAILTTYFLKFNALLIPCSCSVFLEAILILCGKIQCKSKKQNTVK